jgi:YHS domain-containing protein
MKKPKFIADILLAIAVISAAGCGDGADSVNSANSTNSPSATPLKPDLLMTCPVTGDPLGSMGTPYVLVYKGQEVKFCCASCTNDFFKDPDKYMKIIRAADKTATK